MDDRFQDAPLRDLVNGELGRALESNNANVIKCGRVSSYVILPYPTYERMDTATPAPRRVATCGRPTSRWRTRSAR